MLRLLRCGAIAVHESGDAALRSRIAAERVVAPYALCDALDAHGVPAPNDGVSPITSDILEDFNAPT
jgi:hypothetical protein